jgi:alkanesulfonate monooxygenase SsuD/methylene tetrahydromethanopterin reductase-like flavin-dependent oxidoreductase (luciferase family)
LKIYAWDAPPATANQRFAVFSSKYFDFYSFIKAEVRVAGYLTRDDCSAPVRGADPLRPKRAHAQRPASRADRRLDARIRSKPKPYGGTCPLIMNAGASPTGQAFAIRDCDALFSTISRGISFEETARHVSGVRALAQQAGRELDVYTVGVVTCRPTARQAQDYYRHAVVDNDDWAAVDKILAMKNITPQMHSPAEFQRIRDHQANGMGGLPLVGDPDAVAQEMTQLAALGLKGIAVSFVNYIDELPYFCAEVLPRLARAGLREPPSSGEAALPPQPRR